MATSTSGALQINNEGLNVPQHDPSHPKDTRTGEHVDGHISSQRPERLPSPPPKHVPSTPVQPPPTFPPQPEHNPSPQPLFAPPQPETVPSPHPGRIPSPQPQPDLSPNKPVSTSQPGRVSVSIDDDVPMNDDRISVTDDNNTLGVDAQGNVIDMDLLKELQEGAQDQPPVEPMDIDARSPREDEMGSNEIQEDNMRQPPTVELATKDAVDRMEVDRGNSSDDAEGEHDMDSGSSARLRSTARVVPPKLQSTAVESPPETHDDDRVIVIKDGPEPGVEASSAVNSHATSIVDTTSDVRRSTRTTTRKAAAVDSRVAPSKRKCSKKLPELVESDDNDDNAESNNKGNEASPSSPVLEDWKKLEHVFVRSS